MTFERLKGKIHRATVIQAELDYVGSITVDEDLLTQRAFWRMRRSRLWTSITGADSKPIPSAASGQWNDLLKWCCGKMRKYRRQSNYYGLWTL